MEAHLLEWMNLLGRWAHLVVGIAWIGASFYFVWLDNHLLTPVRAEDATRGISGEVWAVHGGGFYQVQKFAQTPPTLPEPLHWFRWEAYSTWLTGMFLLILIYWVDAGLYLVDPAVASLAPGTAVALGAAVLVLGWLVYDGLCRSALAADDRWLALAVFAFTVAAAWGLCQVFSGRGAYIHYGAMLGTIMVANVYFVIMPGQRELVAACREGRVPDMAPALRARQRSQHNTYFTLPVLFVMISNHYAGTYGHTWNWLVLVGLSLAGALIRVWFVQRHRGRASRWLLGLALALLILTIGLLAPRVDGLAPVALDRTELGRRAHAVIQARCTACHAATPSQAGFTAPPKGVVLENPHDLKRQAEAINRQAVLSRAMPIGNLTGMTEAERTLLGQWYAAGAPAP